MRRVGIGLLDRVSRQARHLEQASAATVLDPYYTRAFDLISSPASATHAFSTIDAAGKAAPALPSARLLAAATSGGHRLSS